MKFFLDFKWVAVSIMATVFMLSTVEARAAKVGQKLSSVTIKDANDKPSKIPGLGKKVLTIIYADIQASDDNDAVADALKAKKFDETKYDGVGVANLKDTWAPNAIVRAVIRKKIKKYKSTILADEDLTIPRKWGLGDCDNVSVVIIIGKDQKVKFIKKGKIRGKEIDKVVSLVQAEVNK